MKKNSILLNTLQSIWTQKEIDETLQACGYRDTARKFSVSQLLNFWVYAAIGKWDSFRDSEEQMKGHLGLVSVDYSTLSKKASEVPYSFFKNTLHRLIGKCNRTTLRSLSLPCFATDSSMITVGEGRLPWAKFHGERSGVKLHVRLNVHTHSLAQAEESIARAHDSSIASKLLNETSVITIHDRGYCKYQRMDQLHEENKYFIIRLRKNTFITEEDCIQKEVQSHSSVILDLFCRIGSATKETKHRFRVVGFKDQEGNTIYVATNLLFLPAEEIADLYKARWQVELFFRWIKQHLNVTRLFGTTPNAVYGQLFSALIAYVLIHWLFHTPQIPFHLKNISMLTFMRQLWNIQLPTEWYLILFEFIRSYTQYLS
jgi:hypothetical protein